MSFLNKINVKEYSYNKVVLPTQHLLFPTALVQEKKINKKLSGK